MRGHTRPQSIHRLIAEKHATEHAIQAERAEAVRLAYETEVRAEATAILAERGYRLASAEPGPLGMWDATFVPANGERGEYTANESNSHWLLERLRLYPKRVRGGAFINGALITRAFIDHSLQGFRALTAYARPQ